MLTLLLRAITNLTRLGTIKSVQQAYQLAKRELGDKFNAAKKQIDDAFNQGKKEQTLDKRTKDIKKTEESGIKSLETDDMNLSKDDPMGDLEKIVKNEGVTGLAKSKTKIEKEAEKLKKIAEENKADPDEMFALKSDPVKTDTPLTQKLSKAVEEAKQQMKEIGSLSDAAMQKEQIRNALKSLRDKRIYEMGSGLEGDVRTALRQFVKKEVQEGRLDIPDSYEKKMILEDRQGGVDPIDVFRKAYGEDALIAVDDIFEQYGNKLRGPTYRDIEENFRKLFKFNRGFYDMADLPVPKKEYGFEEGLRSVDTVEQDLINQYKQLDELDKFEPPVDRKANAEGGIMRTSYAVGSGIKLAVFLARKGKDLMTEIKKAVENIFPSGDSKYDADAALDDMFENLNVDRSQFDQKDILDAYGEAYGMITKQRGLGGKVPGGQTPGSKPIKQGEPITSENFGDSQFAPDTSGLEKARELAPKMVERFELKKRFPGIDDDLLTNIIDDPDPQHKAEVIATLEEAFRMLQKGKGTDEVIDILEQGKKTRKDNATGGRVRAASGGLADILKL